MINDYFNALLTLLNEMAPYLLLGFFIAGLLQAFVPQRLYSRHLSGRNMRSVFNAALFGIPLPLCSCGVVPTTVSLRREGASRGASTSFLIATPQTGVDSIAATYSLLGTAFALLRPLAALVTAMFGGWLVNRFEPEAEGLKEVVAHGDNEPKTFVQRLIRALHYGFVEMMQDVGRWLVIGLLLAALISALVPADFLGVLSRYPLLSMLLVLCLSVPMYLCATGSIPIALSLMLKGLSPGAALVLLMAGPATNVASILVIRKVFGRRTTMLYLLAIILGALTFGLLTDYLLPVSWFSVVGMMPMEHCGMNHGASPIQLICSTIFVLLLLYAFYTKYFGRKSKEACSCGVACACGVKEVHTYRVKGMSCNHCKANVEKTVAQVPGVTSAVVDLARGVVTVEGTAVADDVKTAVDGIGYEFGGEDRI